MTVSIQIHGGLGNQLFQIATLLSYSIDYQIPCKFPKTNDPANPRPTYWDNLLDTMHEYLENFFHCSSKYQEPNNFSYRKIPAGMNNAMFNGYFQSYLYFDKNRDAILNKTGLAHKRESTRSTYQELVRHAPGPTISLHFRRGDYQEKREYHPMLTVEYYKNALNYVLQHGPSAGSVPYTILCFYEEADQEVVETMMTILLDNFSKHQFTLIRVPFQIPDWKQLLLMSHCDVNIIANSTFSWWGAYLGRAKLVIYPETWFGPAYSHYDTKDLCPPSWIKIPDGSVTPSSRTGYLLSMNPNSERSIHAKTILTKIQGFEIKTVVAFSAKENTEIARRISNRDSIFSILFDISMKPNRDEFYYVFEDDVNTIEPITLHEISLYEIISKNTGIFYLGGCLEDNAVLEPTAYQIYDHQVYKIRNKLRGSHAFALTPTCAKSILQFYQEHFIDEPASDVIIEQYVIHSTEGVHIVRPELKSPFIESHRGMFYQDRFQFPSMIQQLSRTSE